MNYLNKAYKYIENNENDNSYKLYWEDWMGVFPEDDEEKDLFRSSIQNAIYFFNKKDYDLVYKALIYL